MKNTIIILLAGLFFLYIDSVQAYLRIDVRDTTEKYLYGKILSKKGDKIKVLINQSDIHPEVSQVGIIYAYIIYNGKVAIYNEDGNTIHTVDNIGPSTNVAEAEVIKDNADEITLLIIKKLTKVKVNYKEIDPLKKGIEIRFIWKITNQQKQEEK